MAATLAVGLLAVFAAATSGGAWWLQAALALVAATFCGAAFGGMLRPRVRSVLWRADGGVDLGLNDTTADGQREVQGTIRGARMLGPLIALSLRWPPRGRTTLWLLPDNLDADTRRRLRMRLGTELGAGASGNPDSG